jgi:hypothetical protein
MVSLRNARRGVFLFTLYHDVYCKAGAPCGCVEEDILWPVTDKDSGKSGFQYRKVRYPKDASIAYKEVRQFPDPVLKIPQVSEAIRLGWLRKVEVKQILNPGG